MAVPMASLAGATRSHFSFASRPVVNILHSPGVCKQCLRPRPFSATASRGAGHNKWSKVKHVKAVTDKKKMAERLNFTKLIALYSKMYGDDVKSNPQLASSIAAATKGSTPKALIEAAIARGQGRSATGAQLEPLTLEILMPPNIALIVDVETDNKTRSMHDLKFVVKKAGGVVGSTAFFFSRRGRAVFRAQGRGDGKGPSLTEVMDEALEHEGVEDVEEAAATAAAAQDEGGGYQVWTEPGRLMAVTEAIAERLGLEILESDIVWAPNGETMVDLDAEASADVEGLGAMLAGLREYTEVKAIYANIRQGAVEDGEWDKIERHLDV